MVVPLLGPSTPRDAVGGLLGVAMNPLMWVGVGVPGLGVLFAVNGRAQADDKIETAKRAALDYYVFARDAYVQSDGQGNWWDDSPIGAQPDDLYEVESWDAHPATATATDLDVKIEAEPGSTDAAQ
jgi:ABC-type transporter lipoprotein component MlaA